MLENEKGTEINSIQADLMKNVERAVATAIQLSNISTCNNIRRKEVPQGKRLEGRRNPNSILTA